MRLRGLVITATICCCIQNHSNVYLVVKRPDLFITWHPKTGFTEHSAYGTMNTVRCWLTAAYAPSA